MLWYFYSVLSYCESFVGKYKNTIVHCIKKMESMIQLFSKEITSIAAVAVLAIIIWLIADKIMMLIIFIYCWYSEHDKHNPINFVVVFFFCIMQTQNPVINPVPSVFRLSPPVTWKLVRSCEVGGKDLTVSWQTQTDLSRLHLSAHCRANTNSKHNFRRSRYLIPNIHKAAFSEVTPFCPDLFPLKSCLVLFSVKEEKKN